MDGWMDGWMEDCMDGTDLCGDRAIEDHTLLLFAHWTCFLGVVLDICTSLTTVRIKNF